MTNNYNMILPNNKGTFDQLLVYNNSTESFEWKSAGILVSLTNIKYVDKLGDDNIADGTLEKPYYTLKAAIDSISGTGFYSRWTVLVAPGVYIESNPIIVPQYVSIISLGGGLSTMIYALNINSNLFEVDDKVFIKALTLVGPSNAASVYMANTGNASIINIIIFEAKYGLHCNKSDAIITGSLIAASTDTGSINKHIYCQSGRMDIITPYVYGSATIESLVYASGNNSTIIISTPFTISSNVTNAIYSNNGANIIVISGVIEYSTYSLRIGSVGNNTTLEARNILNINSSVYDVYGESSTAVFKLMNVGLSRDKINVVSFSTIQGYGEDIISQSIKFFTDLSVGVDGYGRNSSFGEGGIYYYGTKVKTYNGSSFADISDLAQISFPNTSANTAIYFGDTKLDKFYSLSYKIGSTPIALGGGSITWEYYDSGTTSWLAFNTLNTINHHSDSFSGSSFTDTVTNRIQSIRFDYHIRDGVTESNTSATGWGTVSVDGETAYWVRVRISAPITTSPIFSSTRFKGSYTSIRSNGTRGYHGEARSTSKELIILTELDAATADGEIEVSTNITPKFNNGQFTDGSEDEIFYRVIITEDMDTSSGLRIVGHFSGKRALDDGNYQVPIYLYSSVVPNNGFHDGNNAEVLQTHNIQIVLGEGLYKLKKEEFETRIDISAFSVDDIVYFKLLRDGQIGNLDDTYPGDVVVSAFYARYYKWQDGSHYV
jgi:hypothetical protein